MISGGRSGVSKVMSIAGLLVSSALLIHTSSRQRPVECASTAKIERDYRSEGALIELLTNIRGTLDQVSSGPIQVSSRDEVYIAVVHRDFIRIQLVSKSTPQLLEFIDYEFNWLSSEITKTDFCRVFADNNRDNVLVEIDDVEAFDIIYRAVLRLSTDLAAGKCKLTRK